MNKLTQRVFALIALLSCVAMAGAQTGGGPGGGQGRGGGGGFGQGRRGGFGGGELQLALRPDVSKEISVTDDQKTKLTDLQTKQREEMRGQFQPGAERPSREEMQKMMAERQEKEHKALAAILNDGQMKRLGELRLQREGNSALSRSDTQKALGLTADQISKIKDLTQKQMEANQAIGEKVQSQEMTREEAMEARQKNMKTLQDEIAKVLTADQTAKFKEMQGKPFKFEQTGRGGGL